MYTILGYLWQYVSNPKAIIALSLLVALLSSYRYMSPMIFWPLLALYLIGLLGYGIYYGLSQRRARKQAALDDLEQDAAASDLEAEQATKSPTAKNLSTQLKQELQQIQQQIKASVQLIRKSKLGDQKGDAALYELPWYMLIGHPAAGKSTAIRHSGLQFPFEETHQKMVAAGLSGTRNCDWFFSTQGVLLDTAGRYSVKAEDQAEWLGVLELLKKNRSKAPINGLIVMVSSAELISQSPEKTLTLAKSLRSRLQEITEQLEVFAPVYVVFSKMDLVAGFQGFFECYEGSEFEQAWGATFAYEAQQQQPAGRLFEQHFNLLYQGLKSVSTTHLSRRHAQNISASVMTFPLEFKSIQPILKTFIEALFEDNPYQFKPLFRGFYFSSALQAGQIESPMTAQIAQTFHLQQQRNAAQFSGDENAVQRGYFLKELFSHVILKDRFLVQQHINPEKKRQRYFGFICALSVVGLCLALWIWSYRNNLQLVSDVQQDLNKVVQLQSGTGHDLSTQLNSLYILQQRLQQLDAFDQDRPLHYSFGLYQGQALRERLKTEYLNGLKQVLLLPTQNNMATYLQAVIADPDQLRHGQTAAADQPAAPAQSQAQTPNQAQSQNQALPQPVSHSPQTPRVQQQLDGTPSAQNPQDAYNALKAYLMLSNPQYREAGHLGDQVTRFWRISLQSAQAQAGQADLIQKSEQILSYAMTLSQDPEFPKLAADAQLVDQSRQVLSTLMRGMPARDRVYNEIKMRAAVRYPALTVKQILSEQATDAQSSSVILGGYALPGVFTQKAWDEYVANAIEDAAKHPTDSKDWVLNTTQSDDLSFSGSPDQIRQQLTQLYKQEYILEWRKFLNAVHYAKAENFQAEVKIMDRLGEAETSPIRTLLQRVATETSWDNPVVQAELAAPQTGFVAWFKRKILRQNPKQSPALQASAQGVIAPAFEPFYQLLRKRDDQDNQSLLDEYLDSLSKVRTQLNDLNSAGEIGPSAVVLVKTTLNEQKSVFNATQRMVDEKLMRGVPERDQQLMQRLLMRPLTQAFEVVLQPAQDELNKLWAIQVYQPFQHSLSQKYPFKSTATIQATRAEIAQILGDHGLIAQFVKQQLDPMLIRRGDTLSAKTWKDMGIRLNPQFLTDFKSYVAPTNGLASTEAGQTTAGSTSQSNFQFYPLANTQWVSYSIDIDGQRLLFEHGVQQWVSFIWPNPSAIPGARITAIDLDGKTHTIFEAPGEYGINRLIDSAQRRTVNGLTEMTWVSSSDPKLFVKTHFRLISNAGSGQQSRVGGQQGYSGFRLVEQITSNNTVRVVAAQTAPTPSSSASAASTATAAANN